MIFGIIEFNKSEIAPTRKEIYLLKKKFKNIEIKDSGDIIRIQNLVIKDIKHEYLNCTPLSLVTIINNSKGLCYDRSFLLQKILIFNHIPIRPVYLYYFDSGKKVSFWDILNPNVNSHSVFEFKWEGKWYVMRTNSKLDYFQNLTEYINQSRGSLFPNYVRYVRYLSNRNSKFLNPWWIPDVYYFN